MKRALVITYRAMMHFYVEDTIALLFKLDMPYQPLEKYTYRHILIFLMPNTPFGLEIFQLKRLFITKNKYILPNAS